MEVVEIIRKKGGRFLRRCDVPGPRGEAYYYDDAADNFELCNVKTEETCYYYDDTGILTYYCAMVSFVTIHNYIIYSVERWLVS